MDLIARKGLICNNIGKYCEHVNKTVGIYKNICCQETALGYLSKLSVATLVATLIMWATLASAIEAPEGVVYCYAKTTIEFKFDRTDQNNDVLLTVNGKTQKLMTAYSWFGSVQAPPKGFKFAILGEGKFDPLLVFEDHLLDAENHKYLKCN